MHKNIKLFYWYNFLTDFCLYAPIAILYFTQVSGSFTLGMSIFSIEMISAAIFEIPTGVYSDKIGRRKTIICQAFCGVITTIFYALGNYKTLVIGSIIEGLGRSFGSGNNSALLHDSLAEEEKEEDYQEHLGKTSSFFQLALAISAIAGSIIANWSFSLVLWLSLIPQLIRFFISFQFVETKMITKPEGNIFAHTREAFVLFIKNVKLRYLSLASILSFGLGEASFQFRSAFIKTLWPVWAIGISQALSNVGAFFSYYFSGKLIRKFKEMKILIGSKIYGFVTDFMSLIFPTFLSPILMASNSIFYGASEVSQNSLMQKEFSDKQRATMSSLNSLAGSLFFGICTILLGITADNIGPRNALLAVKFLSIPIVFIYFKALERK